MGRKFRVGDYEGYIHVGLYDDGTPGDIFVDIAKEGTARGPDELFMISVSIGLQYGVPLEVWVSKFSHMRFEPAGPTNDADIAWRSRSSLRLPLDRQEVPDVDQQEEIGILRPRCGAAGRAVRGRRGTPASAERHGTARRAPPGQTALFNSQEDAVECARCGGRMVRTGSCYTCRDCGTNTGCS